MTWWQRLRKRPELERQLDAELRDHVERLAAQHVAAGLSEDEARRRAQLEFGGLDQVKEVCRDVRGFTVMEDVAHDLRHALRAFKNNPAFTAVAVLTLALGIGANTTIFTLLDAVMFKPLPVPAASELVTFYENGPEGPADPTGGTGRYLRFSYPRFERLEQALRSRGSLAAVTRSSQFVVRLPGSSQPHFLQAQLVSGSYFSTLGVGPARGRVLTADDVRVDQTSPVVVISDGFWKRMFNAADTAIGQTLIVNGVSVTVVGITPPGFAGIWTDREADVWLPLTLQQSLRYENNSSSYGRIDSTKPWFAQDLVSWLNLVARVDPREQANVIPLLQTANRQGLVELASAFENPKNRTAMLAHTLVVERLSRGFSGLRARFSDALFVLAGMVALVLLVTCANIANLLLARAAGQAREVGIRIALGATTGRLVRQGLTESVTLALVGGTAGLVIGARASGFLTRQVLSTSGQIPVVFSPDLRVLAFTAAVSLLTAIAFGLAPALRAVQAGRTASLSPTERHGAGHVTTRWMRSLVVGQLALSVVLGFAAILLGRTLINFMRIDPGFSTDRLVTVSFDPIVSGYKVDQIGTLGQRLLAVTRDVPGITSAAVSSCGLVAGCASSGGFRIEGAEDSVTLYRNWVGPAYFATVGMPLVAGREFDERDGSSQRIAIINETVARRYFPGASPIGKHLGFARPDVEIVGVVRDARTQSLHDAPVPMVYLPIDPTAAVLQTPLTNLDARVAGDPRQVVSSLRDAIHRAEPNLLLGDVGPISARLERDLSRERVVAYLAFGFGALALLLASIGLYGVLSYGVARRTQEIGVRMALGARRIDVIGLVLGQSMKWMGAGLVIGLLAASAAARYLKALLFGVTPLDSTTFLAVPVVLAVVVMIASYVPARRAARIHPMQALRQE